jgi:hypothetical protein
VALSVALSQPVSVRVTDVVKCGVVRGSGAGCPVCSWSKKTAIFKIAGVIYLAGIVSRGNKKKTPDSIRVGRQTTFITDRTFNSIATLAFRLKPVKTA